MQLQLYMRVVQTCCSQRDSLSFPFARTECSLVFSPALQPSHGVMHPGCAWKSTRFSLNSENPPRMEGTSSFLPWRKHEPRTRCVASSPCERHPCLALPPIAPIRTPLSPDPPLVIQALTGAKRKSPEEPDEDAGAANAPHLHAIGIFMPLNEPRCVEPRASSHLPLPLCHCRRAPDPPPSAQMCRDGPTRWPRR